MKEKVKKSNRQVIESLTVTSIEEFRDYLRTEAVRFLHEIELNLKKMPFPPPPERWDNFKFVSGQNLNNLYFEMIDFITWLERELKQVKSKNAKELLNDLQKDAELVMDVRQEILGIGSAFTNKELFMLNQQRLLRLINRVLEFIERYANPLKVFESELLNASVILQRVDDYILHVPEVVGKIKQKINIMTVSDFLSQKESLISSLKSLSEQIEEQTNLLRHLSKVSALQKVFATLELAQNALDLLAKTVRKTDPRAWKESTASFEVFREHLLKDLDGTLKIFTVTAKGLQVARKQLAA